MAFYSIQLYLSQVITKSTKMTIFLFDKKKYVFVQADKRNHVFEGTFEQVVLLQELEHGRIRQINVDDDRLVEKLLILVPFCCFY